ncbi:MAG: 50S ribosomal protein L32 [Chloroflexota bacterium]
MGALPKKKVSRARRGNRRSHQSLTLPTLMTCPDCRAPKVTHRVCPSCGMYNGSQAITIKERRPQAE